ncbi:MAG: hypothetical protein CMI27_00330 [Opitutae bacterium]|nr:hypothetical protein [Opitutae bacterium]|tara:strand:+ start:1503 stop:2282 length:780 start_codon:yes stop_codon:yes gene_type:complete
MVKDDPTKFSRLPSSEQILGISFFQGTLQQACCRAREGGLTVAPSGPGMANDLVACDEYSHSLQQADLRLLDSGFVSLWSRIFFKKNLFRISGLTFLKEYLAKTNWKSETSIWVMPNKKQGHANIEWLKSEFDYKVPLDCFYIAPQYSRTGKIIDKELLGLIKKKKPDNIFIQLGGGVQERLGLHIKKSCSPALSILCTGAALAFFSGQQAKIPSWADKFFLGWLFRCMDQPKIFVPRYLKAFRLGYLLFKYGRKLPVN